LQKYDKGIDRALDDLGIHRPGHIMLPQDEARDMGATCRVCGSRLVVYVTTVAQPGGRFPAGGYCYDHLVKQCRIAACIPFPVEQDLLDRVKQSLGIPVNQAADLSFRVQKQRGK